MPRILLAGATGTVGSLALRFAREKGYWTRALVRSSNSQSRLQGIASEVFVGDALNAAEIEDACRDIDVVVSCIGASVSMSSRETKGYKQVDIPANENLIRLSLRHGVRRFVYLSTFSSTGIADCNYVKAHEAVAASLRGSGLSHTIVRPTGLFGIFAELMNLGRFGFLPMFGDGSARTNPVHQLEVAKALIDSLEVGPSQIDIGGPEVFTRREILELSLKLMGKPPRLLKVPVWTLSMGAAVNSVWNQRLSDLLDFGLKVSTSDCIAEQSGKERLEVYLRSVLDQQPQ